MSKIFKIFAFYLVCVISFISCTKSKDIGELISLRNKYQAELNLIRLRQEIREYEIYGDDRWVDEYGYVRKKYRDFDDFKKKNKEKEFFCTDFEEFQREQLCKDSIEILNIEIDKYKNH